MQSIDDAEHRKGRRVDGGRSASVRDRFANMDGPISELRHSLPPSLCSQSGGKREVAGGLVG